MAKKITVSTSTLRSKASQLRSSNSQFKAQVNNLKAQEQSLNRMWEGDAKNAFHTAFNRDTIQMQNFYNAIEKYCSTLDEIAKQYDNAEKKNQSLATARKY